MIYLIYTLETIAVVGMLALAIIFCYGVVLGMKERWAEYKRTGR